jgi:hypothetical protein
MLPGRFDPRPAVASGSPERMLRGSERRGLTRIDADGGADPRRGRPSPRTLEVVVDAEG